MLHFYGCLEPGKDSLALQGPLALNILSTVFPLLDLDALGSFPFEKN